MWKILHLAPAAQNRFPPFFAIATSHHPLSIFPWCDKKREYNHPRVSMCFPGKTLHRNMGDVTVCKDKNEMLWRAQGVGLRRSVKRDLCDHVITVCARLWCTRLGNQSLVTKNISVVTDLMGMKFPNVIFYNALWMYSCKVWRTPNNKNQKSLTCAFFC